ncbi:hypothetical protein [Endozoicomonas sp. ONNA2]|uniref:hypothetical protein n=1 Tax=Endozoicomonas sp. ONNA2 TaxID=2828741 RepID=UPI002148828D|nr:hypothetical protein [Endozoicomonas sp. ONNA2]
MQNTQTESGCPPAWSIRNVNYEAVGTTLGCAAGCASGCASGCLLGKTVTYCCIGSMLGRTINHLFQNEHTHTFRTSDSARKVEVLGETSVHRQMIHSSDVFSFTAQPGPPNHPETPIHLQMTFSSSSDEFPVTTQPGLPNHPHAD